MRVFLDACIDPRVAGLLTPHDVTVAVELGWQNLPDGELLRRVQDRFDVFVTLDQGIEFQNNLRNLRFRIVIVHVEKNKASFYVPLVPALLDAMQSTMRGEATHVGRES
jgi:predicted nuclease of predicted toxin-antitoxin system